MDITPQVYKFKRAIILGEFSTDFVAQNFNTDQCFKSAVELMIRGKTPYQIIEMLIKDRQETQKRIDEYLLYHSTPTIIVTP